MPCDNTWPAAGVPGECKSDLGGLINFNDGSSGGSAVNTSGASKRFGLVNATIAMAVAAGVAML